MNSQRPFDLGKLDFNGIRLRRRKRLLLYSLPFCIVLLIAAVKFLSIPILSAVAQNQYNHGQYSHAGTSLSPLHIANWFESYKAPFNHGNSLYKKGDFAEAEQLFRKALESVPEEDECNVRINLALSIEAQADAAVENKDLNEAILRYDEVKAVLRDGRDSCNIRFQDKSLQQQGDSDQESSDGNGDKSGDKDNSDDANSNEEKNAQTAKDINNRVTNKSDKAKRARNNDSQESSQSNDSPSDNKSTQDKIQQLENVANEAQRQRLKQQNSQRNSGNFEKFQRKYDKKNW